METSSFKIKSSDYIRAILNRWLMKYAWIFIGILGVLLILGGTFNVAFFIVALIFLFILTPTALMFVYYQYALNPRIVMLSSGNTVVSLKKNKIDVEVIRDEGQPYGFEIAIKEVTSITPGEPYDVLIYGKDPDKILLIEKNSFGDETARVNFHNFIFDRIEEYSNLVMR